MVNSEFEHAGMTFKLSKIDAITQFHVVRKLGPVLSDLLPIIGKLSKVKDADALSETEKLEQFAVLAQPLLNGMSKLSDDDSTYVLMRLLSSAEVRQQEFKSWARVASGGRLMMENIELPTLLQVAGRAFMYNLTSFFSVHQRVS